MTEAKVMAYLGTTIPEDGESLVTLWERRNYELVGDPVASVEDAAISADANEEEGRAEFGCIEVVNPDGTAEVITDYETHEAVEAEASRWRARLGDDRVEVRPL